MELDNAYSHASCRVIDQCGELKAALISRILSVFKYVPYATHCIDQFLFKWIIDLAAQPAYGHIDDVGIAVEIDVPDLLGNKCSG